MTFPGFSAKRWSPLGRGWNDGLERGVGLGDAAPVGSGEGPGDGTGLLRDKKEKQEEEERSGNQSSQI